MKTYNTYGLTIKVEDGLLNQALQGRLEGEGWENSEIKATEKIPKDSVVLELGGCIGITAAVLNKRLSNPEAHVVIEPNPELAPSLLRIKADNKCKYHIRTCVVSLNKGVVDFSLHPDHIMGGRLGKSRNWKHVRVEQLTIKDIEKIYDLNFNCLIMDVEGAEYGLFDSGTEPPYSDVCWLHNNYFTKFKTIMIEFHDVSSMRKRCNNIMKTIESAGYTNEDLGNGVRLFKKI